MLQIIKAKFKLLLIPVIRISSDTKYDTHNQNTDLPNSLHLYLKNTSFLKE